MNDQRRIVRLRDLDSQVLHRLDRALAVLARKEPPDYARAVRQRREKDSAVRHALVAWDPNFRLDRWRPGNQ